MIVLIPRSVLFGNPERTSPAPAAASLYRRLGHPVDDEAFGVVTLAAVAGARHPHPAADRAGGERPAGQAGRA
jgi:hypothetical protein